MKLTRIFAFAMASLMMTVRVEGAVADVVAVVSRDNPIDSISQYELTNIFLGKVRNFPDGRQAIPVDQGEGADAREEFYNRFAGKSPAQIKAYWSRMIFTGRGKPPRSLEDGRQVKVWVAQNANAIGYIDQALVDDSVKVVRIE